MSAKPVDTTHALLEAAAQMLEAHGEAHLAEDICRAKDKYIPDVPLYGEENCPHGNQLSDCQICSGAKADFERSVYEGVVPGDAPTPRTDALCENLLLEHWRGQLDIKPLADFSRQLERELFECRQYLLSEHDAHMECHAKMEKAEAENRELREALIALHQAYSNKHSPQHRAACLNAASAVLSKWKE